MTQVVTQWPTKMLSHDALNYLLGVVRVYNKKFWDLPLMQTGLPHRNSIEEAETELWSGLKRQQFGHTEIQMFVERMLTNYPEGHQHYSAIRSMVIALAAGDFLHQDYWEKVNFSTWEERPEVSAQPQAEQAQAQPKDFSRDPKGDGYKQMMELGRSSSCICCVGSPGVDTHSLSLLMMVAIATSAYEQKRSLNTLVFDSLGRRYMGLERNPHIVRHAYTDTDADPMVTFLDCVYLTYRQLRERLSQAAKMRRLGNEPEDDRQSYLLCIPDWSFQALEWKRMVEKQRNGTIRRWREGVTSRLAPNVVLPKDNDMVDPLRWMRAIAVHGPEHHVRLLLSVNVEDLRFARAGLEADMLAHFSLIAAGQHKQGDPAKFKALEWLGDRMGGEFKEEMQEAQDWSRKTQYPIMLADTGNGPVMTPMLNAFSAELGSRDMPINAKQRIQPLRLLETRGVA